MKDQIEAILAPARAAGLRVTIDKNQRYWAINVNGHAGARTDGVSLARDLMRNAIKPPEPPKPPKETIPEAIADLVRENEPYGEAKARLMALYISLQNKLMLDLASEAEGRTHTRLHGHLAWMAKGAADVTI